MKILIVEDKLKQVNISARGLTEAVRRDHADNGLTGYHLAMTAEAHLVIPDIMLPDVNGWDNPSAAQCRWDAGITADGPWHD